MAFVVQVGPGKAGGLQQGGLLVTNDGLDREDGEERVPTAQDEGLAEAPMRLLPSAKGGINSGS